jgi:succinate dehydrogenase / fumarate reductase cytochrome b subunit
MRLLSDSIGRKAVMAVTGLLMVLFIIGHLLGNLTIFAGADGINAYAFHLHELAPVVWATRVVMGTSVLLHTTLAIIITLENRAANPIGYAVKRMLKASFAGRTMIWTGLLIGAFVIFHLLHFTVRAIPDMVIGTDAKDRFDVFSMVVDAFGKAAFSGIYIVAMIAVFLHLSHGIQSAFQTLGLSNKVLQPKQILAGKGLSTLFLVGFGAIPVAILAGLLAK